MAADDFSIQELAGLLMSGCSQLEAENRRLRAENERLSGALAAEREKAWACEDDSVPSQCHSSAAPKVFRSERQHFMAPEQSESCEESPPPAERAALGSVCRLGPPRPLPLLATDEQSPPTELAIACAGGEATSFEELDVAASEAGGPNFDPAQSAPHSDMTSVRYNSEIPSVRYYSENLTPHGSSGSEEEGDEVVVERSSTSKRSTITADGLKIWPEWREASEIVEQQMGPRPSVVMLKAVCSINDGAAQEIKAGDALRDTRCPWLQFSVMQPGCKKRLFWEFTSLLILAYDIIVIPLQAFAMPESATIMTLNFISTLVWTGDLFGNFLVGYYQDGVLEMRPAKIAMKYLMSFFVVDIAVVSTDWAIIALEALDTDSLGLVRIGKTLRLSRGLRMLHFIRLFKVASFMQDLDDALRSESLRTCIGLLKLVVAILLVNHYIACAWYALGDMGGGNDRDSWLDRLRFAQGEDLSFPYYYSTSLHWSLTQFTPASMEVTPRNAYERAFTIGVIVFALVSFSSFVSSITNAMTHLQRINAQSMEQKLKVRQFILEHQLSFKLSNLIYQFLRHERGNRKKRLHADDIEAFRKMPESLKVHLHYESFTPVVSVHPFFRLLHDSESTGFMNLCHFAISEVSTQVGEDVLAYGQRAEATYFVVSGQLCYHPGKQEQKHESVSAESIVCEMVLWVQWVHRGRLNAETPCDVLKLQAETFREIMSQTPMWAKCCQYAKHYFQNVIVKEPYDIWFEAETSDWMMFEVKKNRTSSGLFSSSSGGGNSIFDWRSTFAS